MLPVVENHAAKATSMLVIVFGFFMEFMQHAAPEIQKIWPDVRWVSSGTMLIGGLWQLIQRFMDAKKQQ